ncbi:MAG: hypothetical protein JWO36_4303 [Myxococcales bacterium]|nr:hypothetical protein [Myxococcales bacterium]
MRLITASWLIYLVVGCAHADVRAHYPSPPGDLSGTLVLQMTQPASDVSVAINGLLVVDNVHTQRIIVDGVPIGTAEIVMAANGADKEFTSGSAPSMRSRSRSASPIPDPGFSSHYSERS